MKTLLTGATGFVGTALLKNLSRDDVVVLGRACPKGLSEENFIKWDYVDDSIEGVNLSEFKCIIHCAARAHVMKETSDSPLKEYRKVNTYGTEKLARKAARDGVEKFIFLSSIKVNGESSREGGFSVDDTPAPEGDYAISKYEAEIALLKVKKEYEMKVLIIRPPLVYGPGVRGNFASMLKLCSIFPISPFSKFTSNKRSILYVENLCTYIKFLMNQDEYLPEISLISDAQSLSTANLFSQIIRSMYGGGLSFPVPVRLFELLSKFAGKEDVFKRMNSSLEINLEDVKSSTGWRPPYSFEESIGQTVSYYKFSRSMNSRIVRFLDINLSLLGLIILLPLILFVYVVALFESGSPLFFQKRVGKDLKPFILIKFRTMRVGTKSVASHLVNSGSITSFGKLLRKTKVDELPQLINVLRGDMSLVGPRPNLYNQRVLITERVNRRVYEVRPGITGLAQLSDVDMSNPTLLANTDAKMIENFSIKQYFKFIFMTALGRGSGDRVR